MPKIPALPPMTSPDGADELPIEDVSVGTTKYITLTRLKEWLQSVAGWVTASNIDFTTKPYGLLAYTPKTSNFATTSTSNVAVTGLSASVTVPAGSRPIKITVFLPQNQMSNSNGMYVSIWEGTVGSGTLITEAELDEGSATYQRAATVMAVIPSPTAGSKTYNVGTRIVNAGTLTLKASSSLVAFILIEQV